jgi:general L-amino acid transport system permease protein
VTSLPALLRDRKVRDTVAQIAVAVALVGLLVFFVRNASENMVKAGIASGFDFLWRQAGIDVPFTLTGYTSASSNLGLLWAGIVNTLLVSAVAIATATLLGFLIGIARLSRNPLLSGVAGAYVEFVRNIPLLFFVLIWYFGVVASLPAPRQSISVFGIAFLNNRGLTVPLPTDTRPFGWALLILALGIAAQLALAAWGRRRQARTGLAFPVWRSGLALVVALPMAAFAAATLTAAWDVPALRGFNYRGGFVLVPEFVALFAALSTYTAGFIAEIVRAGILAVPGGQIEAAKAVGLTPNQTLRLVTVPQALRVMVPPMTSQYLNVIKNSSFGAAIAYPDVVSLFMGSALNNTGQAIEIIAITLALYLSISLAVSAFMNWYNARIALVTR